ncbi:uncharacterized protein K441DRAFT_681270 [Cenococcum geophilum 1.58]|uniref:uncharacterized protein n=1 Tax=Cenococcum geophilum 1.58 TaxID=794803 RepID=UPI00358DF02A|nr:hypothetical protein K441DRAFT_681270 [Cenococcum geophilum 1.58]
MSKFGALQHLLVLVYFINPIFWNTLGHAFGADAASPWGIVPSSQRPSKWTLLSRDDVIPKSPPWVYPNAVSSPPDCVATADDCPWYSDGIQYCSAEKCTMTFFGACMQTATLVDKTCLCSPLSEPSCQRSCNSGLKRSMYLHWLNNTCSDVPDWTGLSDNWVRTASNIDVVLIGNRTEPYGYNGYNGYNSYNLFPEYQMPQVVNSTCPSYWYDYSSFIFNETEVALADPSYYNPYPNYNIALYLDRSGLCPSSYDQLPPGCNTGIARTELLLWLGQKCNDATTFGWPQNWKDSLLMMNSSYQLQNSFSWPTSPGQTVCPAKLKDIRTNCSSTRCALGSAGSCSAIPTVVDTSCFCKEMDLDKTCNPTGIERTQLLLWVNRICSGVSAFPGMPDRWNDSLLLMNVSYHDQSNFTRPSCLKPNDCFQILNSTETNCSSTRCTLDGTGNCTSTPVAVDIPCFCKPMGFDRTCNRNCKLSWERKEYLEWMNSTCSSTQDWNGLPKNWTALLVVQEDELLPWNWQIRATNSTATQHCPSTAAKLGAFAAVNIAMALLVPILGRWDVIKQITFGLLGKRGSRAWLLTGPVTVGLHVASNAIGAYLIKSTRGYEAVNIWQLILLWCTRPRLAWMIVALIPWQAKDFIYFSVAASTLLAEVALQILGSICMGLASNYARKQHFYVADRLSQTPHGQDALVMYAGSLLWLIVILFAIATCAWSILGVNQHIAAFGQIIRGSRRKAKRHHKRAIKRATRLAAKAAQEAKRRASQPHVSHELDSKETSLAAGFSLTLQSWNELDKNWEELQKYLKDDADAFKKAEKSLRLKSKQLRKALKKGAAPENLFQEVHSAEEVHDRLYGLWHSVPTERLQEGTAGYSSCGIEVESANNSMTLVMDRVATINSRCAEYRQRLNDMNTEIDDIAGLLKRYDRSSNSVPGLPSNRSEQSILLFVQRDMKNLAARSHKQRERNSSAFPTTEATLQRRREQLTKLRTGISLEQQRQTLLTVRGQEGNDGTRTGLLLDLHREQETLARFQIIQRRWHAIVQEWADVEKEWRSLQTEWEKVVEQRKKEVEEQERDQTARLKSIAVKTILGMVACWIAQWVWWVGYIRVAEDSC